jgi:hypothetical protein
MYNTSENYDTDDLARRRPRFYRKSELALEYFPDSASKRAARTRLIRSIRRCKGLSERLEECTHQGVQQEFSPKEVALIFEYLGEP